MTESPRSPYAQGPLHEKKFNPINPYEEKHQYHLLREITITTLGWLQSASIQCIFMWLWASGRLPYYNDFWSRPFFSFFMLLGVIYWRAFHFYRISSMINLKLKISFISKDSSFNASMVVNSKRITSR
jgi:hypothetical protein